MSVGNLEMAVSELVELGNKFRPSSEVLKKMSDEKLVNILQKNWKKWTRSPIKDVVVQIPDQDLRELSEIKLFRVLDEKEIEDGEDDSVIDGVTGGRFSSGMAGSSQGFRCLDYGLPTFNRLIKGIRFWVFIAPGDSSSKLEKLIARLKKEEKFKSGCLGGDESFLFDLPRLKKENIEYGTCLQREGSMVFTRPGVYYYWVNLIDFTEVKSVYFTKDDWFEMGKKREVDRCSCRKTFTLNWAKMEREWRRSKIDTKTSDKGARGENKKEHEDNENLEQTTQDQDGGQISKDFETMTIMNV